MFVRTVWRLRRMFDLTGALREMDVRVDRSSDILGLGGVDFSDMTEGHFDHVPSRRRTHLRAGK